MKRAQRDAACPNDRHDDHSAAILLNSEQSSLKRSWDAPGNVLLFLLFLLPPTVLIDCRPPRHPGKTNFHYFIYALPPPS
jgi:hypothetical protein